MLILSHDVKTTSPQVIDEFFEWSYDVQRNQYMNGLSDFLHTHVRERLPSELTTLIEQEIEMVEFWAEKVETE